MTDLYVGAGHGFAQYFLQHRAQQGHTCYEVSRGTGPHTITVDWNTMQVNTLHRWLTNLPELDLIFFNQNASALSTESFEPRPALQTWHHTQNWQQSYFVSCQLPYVIVQTLGTRITARTRVVWMLSGMITRPFADPGHADYIGNKFQNLLIMRNFANSHAGCFLGIDPGRIDSVPVHQQIAGLDQVLSQPRSDVNGRVFGLDGQPAANFDQFG